MRVCVDECGYVDGGGCLIEELKESELRWGGVYRAYSGIKWKKKKKIGHYMYMYRDLSGNTFSPINDDYRKRIASYSCSCFEKGKHVQGNVAIRCPFSCCAPRTNASSIKANYEKPVLDRCECYKLPYKK